MNITTGYRLDKPMATQEQCDAYAAMAQAVNNHNAACAVGDTLWAIEDGETCYTIVEGDVVPEPTPADTTPSAEDDLSALVVDHEYRLTLLELGITEDTDDI